MFTLKGSIIINIALILNKKLISENIVIRIEIKKTKWKSKTILSQY